MKRRVHVVGTVPESSTQAATRFLARELGDHLSAIPDGEVTDPSEVDDGVVDDRANWVIPVLNRRARRSEVLTVRRSRLDEPTDLNLWWHPPIYMARPGCALSMDSMCLKYAHHAQRAWAVLHAMDTLPPGVRLQVGIANPYDLMAMSAWRHYDLEVAAALREIAHICAITAGEVVFQLEFPVPTYLVARAPRAWQAKIAAVLGKRIGAFISHTPINSQWILHPCYGNKNDSPLISPADMGPLVTLINAIIAHWPSNRVLETVHLPAGDRTNPAPMGWDYYAPLAELAVPPQIHVSLGVVRPDVRLERLRQSLRSAETMGGRRLGVSTPCGWGRQPGSAQATADLLVQLAES